MSNTFSDTKDGKANENQHKLKSGFSFWFLRKTTALSEESYEKSIKKATTFNTAEQFWSSYSHLLRPSDVTNTSLTFHLFREGIVPVWEDEANRAGGKWTIRLKKGVASRIWEDIVLAVIGDRFGGVAPSDEVCGVVLALKFNEDVLSVWNKTSANKTYVYAIRDVLKKLLGITPSQNGALEYKPHDESAKQARAS